jgi:hypothetical protein
MGKVKAMITEEDEAFEALERMEMWRKKQIADAMERKEHIDIDPKNIRNATIEEVAQHIEKLKSFGQDTVSSLAIYIREMKD